MFGQLKNPLSLPGETKLRKQLSLYVSNEDWRALRDESIRTNTPMNRIIQEWIGPHLEKLKRAKG